MNEYNEIINKLKNMGIYCWLENGQVVFENVSICEQNESPYLSNKEDKVS